jgi:hypothetical protein
MGHMSMQPGRATRAVITREDVAVSPSVVHGCFGCMRNRPWHGNGRFFYGRWESRTGSCSISRAALNRKWRWYVEIGALRARTV